MSSYYFSRNGEFNFELLKKIDQFPSVNYFKDDKDLYLKPEDTAEKWLDNNDLNQVFPLFGYEASQIIIGNLG